MPLGLASDSILSQLYWASVPPLPEDPSLDIPGIFVSDLVVHLSDYLVLEPPDQALGRALSLLHVPGRPVQTIFSTAAITRARTEIVPDIQVDRCPSSEHVDLGNHPAIDYFYSGVQVHAVIEVP